MIRRKTGTVDPTQAPFLGDEKLLEKREEQLQRVNHRREARLKDADRWEEDRLRLQAWLEWSRVPTTGTNMELCTQVVVHDMKPPFLDGRVVFSKQSEPVLPVKDPTSDMAVLSKKGSQLMRDHREKRSEARPGEFDMAGTVIGNILGVKAKSADEEAKRSDVQDDQFTLSANSGKGAEAGGVEEGATLATLGPAPAGWRRW